MEVFCKVVGEDVLNGERYLAATSFWTFVALPREGETDFTVDAIVPETDEEKFICSGYEERRKARLEQLGTPRSINGSYYRCKTVEPRKSRILSKT